MLAALAFAGQPAPVDAASATDAGKTVNLKCRGGSNECKTVVSLSGGASNKKLRIVLTGTDFKLLSVTAKPSSVKGAYNLSKGTFSLGGSLYTVTLNAVQSIGKGATLTLRFATPPEKKSCKAVAKGIADLTVSTVLGVKPANGAFGCQQANAASETWLLRFNAMEPVEAFEVSDVKYRCKAVQSVPQNQQCEGAGTRVRFAGPTGH
jgi:hypothetical protein